MRIKCNCGKELKITQLEIDKGDLFLCLNCDEYHYLDLAHIKEPAEWFRTHPNARVRHK